MVFDQLRRLNLIFYGIGSWRNSQAFVCWIRTLECGLCFLDINFTLSLWAFLINVLLFSFKKFVVNLTHCSQMLFSSAIRFPSWFFLVYLDLRKPHDTEFVYKLWKSLKKLFDFREYFCAFYSGSGEADTSASSFTTSGEEPLETTTSEMTGLLLKKISFSFRHGQWYPSCQHCNIFKKITGFFVGC